MRQPLSLLLINVCLRDKHVFLFGLSILRIEKSSETVIKFQLI